MDSSFIARHITIKGLVQGVGFRPFVYKTAQKLGLMGWVKNTNEGVLIQAEGPKKAVMEFLDDLKNDSPEASAIHSIQSYDCDPGYFSDFRILKSNRTSDRITQVSPDISVCKECLADMKTQAHRYAYPFINCTHCGPRFTIIRSLPYDREKTTMDAFTMCDECRREYELVTDRRFHAQPVACNHCGPHYTLYIGEKYYESIEEVLNQIVQLLREGGILAMKGLGGYYLCCDANNEKAVGRLRKGKKRSGKPFAVMVKDIETAACFAELSKEEKELLGSWRRPIVLAKQRRKLAEAVNPGILTLGLMLPHMPFHYQLFEYLDIPALVMTSGNISEEPIVIGNREALQVFNDIADGVLTYNREIHNRTDDSVAIVVKGEPRLLRRSKGYVPEPIRLSFSVDSILGVGAELSHCFAMGKDREVLLSQHIGDLKDPKTFAFFEESVSRFRQLFSMQPKYIACDLHPDYLSSDFASHQALPQIQVQHHHAHIAACMAEFDLKEPVLGVCWDGTGFGSDGKVWGGEFMYVGYDSFDRFSHFKYVPLPGGDKAALEPWRMAVSYLYQLVGDKFIQLDIPFVREIRNNPELELLLQGIQQKVNAPLTSSAGRLFDAVAAILNLCKHNTFHAEAPMKLESIIEENIEDEYSLDSEDPLNFGAVIAQILSDIEWRIPEGIISAKFHNTLITVIHTEARKMKEKYGTRKLILTGGVFQNRYLLQNAEKRLEKEFTVYCPRMVPANDAGIALGQVVVAANILKKEYSPEKMESCV